ncbi:hypothetical protein F4781DRAFT_388212 [Annulohypoxylon bovei var. microspora]|nr:hypothetical protein F4781DRAFT_388212 [Annulohypoxylon bovei var. microspora]
MAAVLVANLFRMWLMPIRLLFLSILTQPIGAQDPTPTTVSVFLPSYGPRDWTALRGSILSSNDAETRYTIFCAQDKSYGCNIGGGTLLPFTFAEGPSTYHYEQTIDSTISIYQACLLSDTTAATCSGSTSLGAITLGPLSGPSSTSVAPFTLTGPSIHWGVLTLAAPPLTSVAGSLTFTYYGTDSDPDSGSETPGLAGTPASTPFTATATATDGEITSASISTSPSAAVPESTSSAGRLELGRGRDGGVGGVAARILVAVLVPALLW